MKKLSVFRTELMGGAILLVVLFHMCFRIDNNGIVYIPITHGMIGVDIFFLLSGIGLYFSLYNGQSLKKYYIKRFKRIFPFYSFVIFVTNIIAGTFTLRGFVLKSTTIGYWLTNEYHDWYVPNLILSYICFPIWYKIVSRNLYLSTFLWSIVTLIILIIPKSTHVDFMSVTRYPSLLLGGLLGHYLCKEKEIKHFHIIAWSLFCVGLIVLIGLHNSLNNWQLIENGWLFKPHIFMTVGCCFFFLVVIRYFIILKKILFFFGCMSFEVYLLHGVFVGYGLLISEHFDLPRVFTGSIFLLFSFATAWLCHLINKRYFS